MIKKKDLSDYNKADIPCGAGFHIDVVAALWNREITDPMLEGAVNTLRHHGVEKIDVYRVPGTFELTSASQMILSADPTVDSVICIGCVIQGETRHFEFICQAVSQGLTNVSVAASRPVIFSVLTTDTVEQAVARSGGEHGNKGIEGAQTALQMCALRKQLGLSSNTQA